MRFSDFLVRIIDAIERLFKDIPQQSCQCFEKNLQQTETHNVVITDPRVINFQLDASISLHVLLLHAQRPRLRIPHQSCWQGYHLREGLGGTCDGWPFSEAVTLQKGIFANHLSNIFHTCTCHRMIKFYQWACTFWKQEIINKTSP